MSQIYNNTNHRLDYLLIFLFFIGVFFFQNSFVSFKIIYATQILIILFFLVKYSNFSYNKKILILNLLGLSLLFYEFDKSYVYLFLICFLNIFFNLKNINKIVINNNILILFIFSLVILTFLKSSGSFDGQIQEVFFYQEVLKNINHYNECNVHKTIENCNFEIRNLRYGFMNIHPNLTAIFCLIVSYIFLKDFKKKLFILYFFLFGSLFLLLTLSKSGLLFFVVILFLSIFKINEKIIISLFFISNIILALISFQFSNKISNFWDKSNKEMLQVYQNELCPKIENIPILNYFNECKYKTNSFSKIMEKDPSYLLFNVMGYSTFYKLHSYGMVVDNIFNNFKNYILPNPLERLKKKQIINDKNINGELSAHGIFFLIFLNYGILLGLIFCVNLYIFLTKVNEKNLFLTFLISSTFLSLDAFLIFPFILLSIFIRSGYKKQIL